jgi:hypothetical protein
MKRFLMIALLLASTLVWAQTVMRTGITYSDPTQYTDNSALPASEIAARTLDCGLATKNYTLSMLAPAGGAIPKEEIFTSLALEYNKQYFCAMTVTASNGQTSEHSNEVNFIVEDQRVPKAPVLSLN